MFDWIATPEGWIALATLFALEVVLGIDNIVFLSILVGRLPPEQRELARKLGLGLALVARLALLFSITWVMGLVGEISLMAVAIVLAVIVMLFAAKPIGDFVDSHPTVKILALSFLILVGVTLIAEGLDFHVPKGYIYFAMAFSVAVEMINIRMRKRAEKPVRLNKSMRADVPLED